MRDVQYSFDVDGSEIEPGDAFGEPLTAPAAGNGFSFTLLRQGYGGQAGREWLSDLGLYDYRNRAYSPLLGRWLQPDPIGFAAGDVNLYRYCGNGVLGATDGFGLTTTLIYLVGRSDPIRLIDPSMALFRNTIRSLEPGSIRKLKITGHGGSNSIDIEETGGGGLVVRDRKMVVFTDNVQSFANLIRPFLAPGAIIDLNGCYTGAGDLSIAEVLSRELMRVTIRGNNAQIYMNEISYRRKDKLFLRLWTGHTWAWLRAPWWIREFRMEPCGVCDS